MICCVNDDEDQPSFRNIRGHYRASISRKVAKLKRKYRMSKSATIYRRIQDLLKRRLNFVTPEER